MPTGLTNTTTHPSSGTTQLTFDAIDAATTHSTQDVQLIYPSASKNYKITTAVIPPGSKFHPGAHWHEDYDEIMRVVKGRARIRLGKEWRVYGPEDGEVLIRRGVVHDFMRADASGSVKGEDGVEGDLVIEEWSEPVDGSKELFFRHAFSIQADSALFGWKIPLQMLLLLMYTDTFLELVPGPVGWYVTHGLYAGVVAPLAWVVGVRPFYDEYTPERLAGVRGELEGRMGKGKKD
ncbi:hypothetical protein K458DRAFT_488144 [Lentithecium fluviatile CBS 122367]|uniref:Uncharacterized protein n=1 Tax=Lentithecium fluviatile CBS 122367 TaxID=1168545 RepID=A0A6G1IYC1_9PLEO|nr:hypothetical protein K458DRAFT_488144 [Lentithecium fluviatile CBS 122367]